MADIIKFVPRRTITPIDTFIFNPHKVYPPWTERSLSDLFTFAFNGHEVRAAVDDLGGSWYCAEDVYRALNVRPQEDWLPDTDDSRRILPGTEMLVLHESCVHFVLFQLDGPMDEPCKMTIEFTAWMSQVVRRGLWQAVPI